MPCDVFFDSGFHFALKLWQVKHPERQFLWVVSPFSTMETCISLSAAVVPPPSRPTSQDHWSRQICATFKQLTLGSLRIITFFLPILILHSNPYGSGGGQGPLLMGQSLVPLVQMLKCARCWTPNYRSCMQVWVLIERKCLKAQNNVLCGRKAHIQVQISSEYFLNCRQQIIQFIKNNLVSLERRVFTLSVLTVYCKNNSWLVREYSFRALRIFLSVV